MYKKKEKQVVSRSLKWFTHAHAHAQRQLEKNIYHHVWNLYQVSQTVTQGELSQEGSYDSTGEICSPSDTL